MAVDSNGATALRAKEGGAEPSRTSSLVSVDIAAMLPPSAGFASIFRSLHARCDEWATSPEIYALALRADAAPTLGAAAPDDLAALTALAWRLDGFPKPLVAFVDTQHSSITLALTQHATHRVGGAAYRFAVPGFYVADGLPLGGIAHALARLPDAAGMYLALTGSTIGPADALALGLLTHAIESAHYAEILTALGNAQPADPLLDAHLPDPRAPTHAPNLAQHCAAMARCFSASSPDRIVDALAAETGAERAWAEAALSALTAKSARELAATHRLVSAAAALDLSASLVLSHSIARQLHDAGPDKELSLDRIFSANAVDFSLPARTNFAFGRF